MINVTILGTAGALPLPERALTAFTLSLKGRHILFDCGEGTQVALRRAGINFMKIDMIALTHYHGDHVFGLPGLLQTMNLNERTEPLYIAGPVRRPGTLDAELDNILALTGRLEYELRLAEIGENGLELHKILPDWPEKAVLRAFKTEHRVLSQGYRFELARAGKFDASRARALSIPLKFWSPLQHGETVTDGDNIYTPDMVLGPERRGISVAFTGDTMFCDSAVKGAAGADLLISEATYGDPDQEETAAKWGHMTFSQAGRLAAAANVRDLRLVHFSQRINDPEEFLDSARAYFPEAKCGTQGEQLVLSYKD